MIPRACKSPPRQWFRGCAIVGFISVLSVVPGRVSADGRTRAYAARIEYAPGTVPVPGGESILNIVVSNIAATKASAWIGAVIVDFSQTGILPLDPGRLPVDWQGTLEHGTVITYVAGHGASAVQGGKLVRLTPRIRNPLAPRFVALPRIIVIPLKSMPGFEGPALRAIERVPFTEVRPTGRLQIKPLEP